MVQTKAFIYHPHPGKRLATTGLILGISSIILNVAGMTPGILAIIFGIITLAHKRPYAIRAVISIVLGCIGIVVSVIAGIFILGPIIGTIQQHLVTNGPFFSTPIAGAQQQIDEPKNFTINQTAKIGAFDYKVLKVVPNYTPTADQVSRPSPYPGEFYQKIDPSTGKYGTIIEPADAEFVLVDLDVSRNDSPNLNESSVLQLNNVLPLIYPSGRTRTPIGQVEYVFRIRESAQLTLTVQNTITTASLFLVGSEGAPHQRLTYTILLN